MTYKWSLTLLASPANTFLYPLLSISQAPKHFVQMAWKNDGVYTTAGAADVHAEWT